MNLHDDDGLLTKDAMDRIIESYNAKGITWSCCNKPKPFLDQNLASLGAIRAEEDGIVPLQRHLAVVVVSCSSCGEVRSYALAALFPGWEEDA